MTAKAAENVEIFPHVVPRRRQAFPPPSESENPVDGTGYRAGIVSLWRQTKAAVFQNATAAGGVGPPIQ
jgi:hypothetical protein